METDTQIAGSRQRRWTTAQKLEIVEESLAPGARVAELALSSERPRSRNPRLAVLSLSSSAEGRDASWFTTCVCNGITAIL